MFRLSDITCMNNKPFYYIGSQIGSGYLFGDMDANYGYGNGYGYYKRESEKIGTMIKRYKCGSWLFY